MAKNQGSMARLILDEIALEGLEGITLESLWVYMADTLKSNFPLSQRMQEESWSFLLRQENHLTFYQLPVERSTVKLYKRYDNVDPYLGVPISPDDCPFVRYKVNPINDSGILGSCEYYKERKKIDIETLRVLPLKEVMIIYGNKLVVVASQDLRFEALLPVNVGRPKDVTPIQYCVWEAIGRSRYNGETTAGACSLLDFCKDSAVIFYIKNKLLRYGIIAHQPLNEIKNGRLVFSSLLSLPRFYTGFKSVLTIIVEKLYFMIKNDPKNRISLVSARECFPTIDRRKFFQKITSTHFFRRLFNIYNVPYSEIKTPARRKDPTAKERPVVVVELRNPNITLEEIFVEDHKDEKKEPSDDFYDNKHAFVDMPLKDEFYRAVVRHGERGISQTDLCNYLSQSHLIIRQLLKKMQNEGLLTSYCVDIGRQRVKMYVATEHSERIDKANEESVELLRYLKCDDEPNIPDNKDAALTDIPSITASIKDLEFDYMPARENFTQRQVARKSLIVRVINEKCLIQISELRSRIHIDEKSKGIKDEVCAKSVRRLLHNMSNSKILNLYLITLNFEEHTRSYKYITHPKISIDHKVLKEEVLKLKNNLFLNLEDRRLRQEAQEKDQRKKTKHIVAKKSTKFISLKRKKIMQLNTHKPPKFIISRFMHEFLFYIIVELNESQTGYHLDEEVLKYWKINEPEIQVTEYLSEMSRENTKLLAYSKDINWRTFIPPLPIYGDKPAGWVYFIDAVQRIPLSLFIKIFSIEKGADERLYDYINHPIRQHYLMRQLPVDLQIQISRIQMQKVYVSILKLLNHMGLIQVNDSQIVKDPLVLWVYYNRHAKIWDTTSSEPSYAKINPNREYPQILYKFNSFDDISQYWTNLQRICTFTKLGMRKTTTERMGKLQELKFLNTVDFDEAPQNDVGDTPGDHLGAAGLNTKLCAHISRNWSWVLHTNAKPPKGRERVRLTKLLSLNRKLRTCMPQIHRLQHGIRTKNVTKNVKKAGPRDAIDRDAIKNMRTLRTKWRKEEDEILLIARTAYVYIAAPVAALGSLTMGKVCRDIIRHCLGIYNKTSQACSRRAQFLTKNRRHVPQVPTWLHLLQINPIMLQRYGENFLKKLTEAYPNRTEYCDALTLHLIRITRFVYGLVNNTDNTLTIATQFIIPDTITEFKQKFTETFTTNEPNEIVYENPESEYQLQIAVVTSVLHSSLCSSRDKTLYNLQAFEIYKTFSEEVLRTAFTKARVNSLVVPVKRNYIQLVPNQIAGPAYLLSARYRARLIFLKIPYSVYDLIYNYFDTAINCFFKSKTAASATKDGTKSYLELKSPHNGQLIMIGEGLLKKYWNLTIQLPVNILTVDADQRDTVSSMDRILDHYSTIFENTPQTEYLKQFEAEPNEKQVRVKFHPANLSYKIHYSPFDLISKLPTRYLHFFCALDHYQQEVDIYFSKCRKDDQNLMNIECPFTCVMKNAHYINAIERIVHEKKSILNSLTEMPAQKLLNMASNGCAITVQQNNLLTLVKMLESFCRERDKDLNRKDFGKISTTLKVNKSIDWLELCKEINEYNIKESEKEKTEGYEPTLNKEERIVRAQDVFVVNLPILKIDVNTELSKNKNRLRYNEVMVPKVMLETDIQKESIFKKCIIESHWKYTENTFETLKQKMKDLKLKKSEEKLLEEIHNYIEQFKFGVSAANLLQKFSSARMLTRILLILRDFHLIKRVGIAEFVYVHKSHIRPWVVHTFHIKRLENEKTQALKRVNVVDAEKAAETEEIAAKKRKESESHCEKEKSEEMSNVRSSKPIRKYSESNETDKEKQTNTVSKRDVIAMKPQPWIRLNGSLNRRVLDRWLGTILTECVTRAGCSVHSLCTHFMYLYPTDIMFLLEILIELKCIRLMQLKLPEVDLFSNYQNIEETEVVELYEPKCTFIKPCGDAYMRLTIFIGKKKYSTEFIQES